jgi:hypothetical protein
MSDGGGLSIGIGAGMAIGIAMGAGVGKKKAKEAILRQASTRAISLRDSNGNEIPLEQFLDETIATESKPRGLSLAVLILGIAVVVGILIITVLR